MHIERIIEFELRKPGSPDHTCTVTPKTGYLHYKAKNLQNNFSSDLQLTKKLLQSAMYLASSFPWAKLLSKFNPNCKVLNIGVARIFDWGAQTTNHLQ